MKLIKFVKENKIIVFSLFVVVLAFVFLALPGQFAKFDLYKGKQFNYELSGYQFIFGLEKGDLPNKAIPQGIAVFVMLILAFVGLIFSKKSSFVSLITSLVLITVSVLFFTISVAGSKIYVNWANKNDYAYLWVPYLIGGLTVVAGGLMMFRTIVEMKNEIQHPAKPQGPQYNYLHK